jgi:hypothetical protein
MTCQESDTMMMQALTDPGDSGTLQKIVEYISVICLLQVINFNYDLIHGKIFDFFTFQLYNNASKNSILSDFLSSLLLLKIGFRSNFGHLVAVKWALNYLN